MLIATDPGAFFQHSASALAVLSPEGTVLRGNGAFARAFSIDGHVAERPFTSLLYEADRPRAQAALEAIAAGGAASFDARPLECAAGTTIRSLRFQLTRAPGAEVLVDAVSPPAGRAADEPLEDPVVVEKQRKQLELIERVVNQAPVILASLDKEGRFTSSEGGALRAVGRRPGEGVGESAIELYRDNPGVAGAFVRAIQGEELHLTTNPRPGVYLAATFLPLRAPDGTPDGAISLAIDISEQMRSQQELRDKLDLIERQSSTIRALATPIIKVWDEVLCLPVIGTVDSSRAADMMQALLDAIMSEQARYAIVDLTGVEVVDTATADHLIRLFRAAKTLGVDSVLCGLRPAVAQAIVSLGVDLGDLKTKRSLRDALQWCMRAGRRESTGTAVALP